MSEFSTFALLGGLDEITQPLAIKPGRAIAAVNHEVVEDGYRRVDGFERFDGRTSPTDFQFWLLPFDEGNFEIEAGDIVTGATSGATGVVLVDADVNGAEWPGALDFDFTAGTLSSRITAAGGANGTRINAAGALVAATTPRFDYDPILLTSRGVLTEVARTNALLRAAEFDNASWTKVASSVTANAAISPDGALTMDKLVEDSTNALHYVIQGATITVAQTNTFSFYAKAGERSTILIHLHDQASPGNRLEARFDLAAGTVSNVANVGNATGATATITSVGGGIYRCTLTGQANTSGTVLRPVIYLGFAAYLGDGVSGAYIWGAQVEAGAFATSYIPTAGATVTRTADSLTTSGASFSDWWGALANTILVHADSAASGTRVIWQADDGTANNRVTIWLNGTSARATVVTGGVTQADLTLGTVAALTPFRIALAIAGNDIAASLDGAAVQTDAVATLPVVDRCRYGADTTGNELSGHIWSAGFMPRRATNANLQALSAGTTALIDLTDGYLSGTIGLRAVVGDFDIGETILVGGFGYAEVSGELMIGTPNSGDAYEDQVSLAARDYARALIQAVPGSGPIRGIVELDGIAYAFRNNVGATAVAIYKSSAAGWVAVSLGYRLPFTSGGVTEILVGDTITGATSGATAVIRRVVLQSGTWGAGDAAGYFTIASFTGVFVAENLNVGAGLNLATIAAAPTANTLPAGGRYHFLIHNFYAGSDSRRIYGANGVGPAFEFDGTYFTPIFTGATIDTPERVAEYRNQLFLAMPHGLVQGSAPGEPIDWDALSGAFEFGVGSDVADFISHTDSLIIIAKHSILSLTGYDSTDFVLGTLTKEAGGRAYTAQRIGAGLYLDNRGLRSISATQAYGNFAMGTITETVKKTMARKVRGDVLPIASTIVRSKNHYRLFYDDGSGLSFFIGRKEPEPMYFDLGKVVQCIFSSEDDDGAERVLFGDADGYVHQLDKGISFDGEEVGSFIQLPYSHMGSPNTLKKVRKIALEATCEGTSELGLAVEFDYSNNEQFATSQAIIEALGTGALWGVGNWAEFFWSSPTENVLEADVEGQGFNASIIIFSTSAVITPYVLRAATFYFTLRGNRR